MARAQQPSSFAKVSYEILWNAYCCIRTATTVMKRRRWYCARFSVHRRSRAGFFLTHRTPYKRFACREIARLATQAWVLFICVASFPPTRLSAKYNILEKHSAKTQVSLRGCFVGCAASDFAIPQRLKAVSQKAFERKIDDARGGIQNKLLWLKVHHWLFFPLWTYCGVFRIPHAWLVMWAQALKARLVSRTLTLTETWTVTHRRQHAERNQGYRT